MTIPAPLQLDFSIERSPSGSSAGMKILIEYGLFMKQWLFEVSSTLSGVPRAQSKVYSFRFSISNLVNLLYRAGAFSFQRPSK